MNASAQSIADECHSSMSARMSIYQENESSIRLRQREIIDSIATTQESFDSLRQRLSSLNDELLFILSNSNKT
jgi:Mg2+ and Co2+ transporter CorA